jgi:hypothetical protein
MATILTKQQINHLLEVYHNDGPDAARKLAPQYGVKPAYVKKLAFQHGVRVKLRGRDYVMPKRLPSYADPRWQRARAIGAVVV